MPKIRVTSGQVAMTAELNETPTASAIWEALPFESDARLWGKEVYFEIPVHHEEDDAQAAVPSGTVAFWPPGDCLCLFYGQTPASPVNAVGMLDGDPDELAAIPAGARITVERVE